MDNPDLSYAVIDVFFGIAILMTVIYVVLLFAFIKYRHNRIVRRDTPNITVLMLVGGILSGIAMIFLCMKTTTAICWLEGFFSYAGTSLLIAGIIAKSYRVYRIFNNRTAVAVTIKDWQLLVFMFAVLAYFMVVFGLSLITGYGAYTTQSESNPYYIFTSCTIPSSFWRVFFRILLAVSYLILIFVALIIGFLTRHVPSAYGSTKAIYIVSVTILMTFILFQPLYYLTTGSTDSETIRAVIKLELGTISSVAFIAVFFVPTIYQAYRYEKRIERRNIGTQ